jgi:hypothetical protein
MEKEVGNKVYVQAILLLTLFIFFHKYTFASTTIVLADITSVEPIYINFNIEKVASPCDDITIQQSCWRFDYNKNNTRTLKGFRITLNYNGQTYISRTRSVPEEKQLMIRIRKNVSHLEDGQENGGNIKQLEG